MNKSIFINRVKSIKWSPLNDTGVKAWFDASDTSTLFDATSEGNIVTTNNGTVLRWENKVPVGTTGRVGNFVGSESGTTKKYKFVTNYVNGLGCLGGTGVDKCMGVTFTKIFPFTVYSVTACFSTVSTWKFSCSVLHSPGDIRAISTYWEYVSQTQNINNACLNEWAYATSTVPNSTSLLLHAVRSIDGNFRQENCVAYSINGKIEAYQLRQSTTCNPTACATALTNIGNRADMNVHASTRICEIILTPTTDLDIQSKYEGYLAHKWGLEGELPSDHPYKQFAPLA